MLHSTLQNLTRNVKALQAKALDLEIKWAEGKRPNLHPYVAGKCIQELDQILREVKRLDDRYWFIQSKVRGNDKR